MKKVLRIILIISLLALVFRFDFNIDKTQAQDFTIPQEHPRIWWTTERLEKAKQWYAANPFTPSGALNNAFVYVLTNESSYARVAIDALMNFYVSEAQLNGVASDTYRWSDWVPIVFDWCYNEMTEAERQEFTERYNRYVDIIRKKSWGGPGFEQNNYYWGYFRNELNWAIATYYHNPMAQTFLDHALITRWENSFLPHALNKGKGGVTHEGSGYGAVMLSYPVVPLTTVGLLGRDLYNETNFFKEAIFYMIYTTTPAPTAKKGSTSKYYQVFPFNDDEGYSGYPAASRAEYTGDFMTTMATNLRDTTLGEYARHWLNVIKPSVSRYIKSVDAGGAEKDYTDLPLDYYSPGIKYFYMKNSWEPDATSILLQLGTPSNVGHAHLDAGSFQIWKNGYWLSKESTGYSMSFVGGSSTSTIAHNGIVFEGKGLAYAWKIGPPEITRVESNDKYAYATVDLSKAYRASKEVYDNRHVATVLREFVFIKPLETLIVLDRLQSTNEEKPADEVAKTFLIHFPYEPLIEDQNNVLAVNGNQSLRLTTLLPQTPTYNIVSEADYSEVGYNQFRLEVNTSGQEQSYFIHVLQAKDSNGANINTQLKQDASSFTINLDHPSLGKAIVNFNKGMESVGGAIGYSSSELPTILTPFIDKIQGIEVTDNGPVWLPKDTPPITLTKQVDKSSVQTGDILTYTISYAAIKEITNAKIEDSIPIGTTYVANSATNGGTCTSVKCTWNLGTLAPGANGSVQFQVEIE